MTGPAYNKQYYPFLDGFRALAISWVILHHIFYFFDMYSLTGNSYWAWGRLAYLGFLGVDVFFVISGFLITGLLVEDKNSQIRILRFYLRRCFKIIPHYYLIILAGLILFWTIPAESKKNLDYFPGHLVLLQNYSGSVPLLAHTWSIAVEEHFYLIYPLLIALIFFLKKEAQQRRKWLTGALLLLIISGNFLRYYFFKDVHSLNNPGVWQVTHVRFDALIFGCLLRVWENALSFNKSSHNRLLAVLFFALGFALFLSFFFRFNKVGWTDYTLVYLATGAMFVSALKRFHPLIVLTENTFLRWIGKNSYGIYLWHYPIIVAFRNLFMSLGMPWGVVSYVSCSIFLGVLTTRTVERYFLNLRKSLVP